MGFVICYIATAILFFTSFFTGTPLLSSLVFAFIIIPLADLIIGPQKTFLEEKSGYIWAYLWLPVQATLLGCGVLLASSLSWGSVLAWGVPMGLIAGAFGITLAHEVGHRYDKWSQAFATILLSMVSYAHFTIEHNLGHHLNVATRGDPATGRRGETLWAFLPRTVYEQYIHAWGIEERRLIKAGKDPWSQDNAMFKLTGLSAGIPLLILIVLGVKPFVFFAVQAIVAVFLLECINYVEHYGLVRRNLGDKYERVTNLHSWNANFWLTNHLFFRLQQHADHHAHTSKKFGQLVPLPGGPQLPFGYPTMVLLALLPPLWFKIMNPKVRLTRILPKD